MGRSEIPYFKSGTKLTNNERRAVLQVFTYRTAFSNLYACDGTNPHRKRTGRNLFSDSPFILLISQYNIHK